MAGYHDWPAWLEFDEERDLKHYKAWFADVAHSVPIRKPFSVWVEAWNSRLGLQYGDEMLSVPTTKGWDGRSKDGYFYWVVIEPTEEEQRQREPLFREKLAPWIEDFEQEWREKLVPELVEMWERLKKVDVDKLSNIELLDHFDDWILALKRSSEIHFLAMFAVYNIYMLFDGLCKELLDIDGHHPQFKKLMAGFENKMFEVDKGLWQLADRAKELGLEPAFQAVPDDEQLLSKLGESEGGKRWLGELHQFLDEYGWRVTQIWECSLPSWIEKPSLALPDVRRNMAKGGVFVLEQEREQMARERQEVERDILSRVPAEKKGWFEKLMRAAQWAGPFSEEHNFYIDFYVAAMGRRVTKEIGTRFARAGATDEPDDIYFLVPDEIRLAMIPMGHYEVRKLVQIRKEQFQEFGKDIERPTQKELFLGDWGYMSEMVGKDPVLRVIVPVPVVKPELKADLYGTASSPGDVEGIARVIMGPEGIPSIQPGEILVTTITTAFWTPLFAIVKAVVTDGGGSLSHPVIVGREYGIPVVAGCVEATRKVKSGDRIRVDGDNGAVYIL